MTISLGKLRVSRSAQDDNFKGEASRLRYAQDDNFTGVRAQADNSKEVRAQDHNIGQRGDGASDSASVPLQPGVDTNLYGTAHAARVQRELHTTGRNKIVIEIEKHLPVQGGMGAASSNAVATMLAMERALGVTLAAEDKLRIAAEVGSDLPLFLIGGTVLGVGRGEEVFPLPDLPPMHIVVVTPPVGVSTPRAFARWDELVALEAGLTHSRPAGTIDEFSQRVFAWLRAGFPQVAEPRFRSGFQLHPVFPQEAGTGPRHRFSTSSEPGSKTTSKRSSFLSIPICVR